MLLTKRTISFLIIIAAMSALVVPALAQDEVVIAPVPCEEPGELTMWVWDENWADIIQASIDVWEADYCEGATINLEVVPWGQYWDLLQTGAAGGDLPDVFNMSQVFFPFYAGNDVLLDLTSYFDDAGLDPTVWGTGMVDPYRWGEGLYAAPVNWDTIALFYNKDMFDAAGLDYPTADWTWDDFAGVAEALTTDTVYGAAVFNEYQAGYSSWIASTGVPPVVNPERTACTLTEEGSIEALSFLKGLQDEGYMPTVSVMGGGSADDAFNFWLSEQVAMVTGGSWKLPTAISDAEFAWDVVQIPANPETGESRASLHAVGYVAHDEGANPDLAANLIIFLASDEAQRFFAEGGGVAPANPALQQVWLESFESDANIQAFVEATKNSQGVTLLSEFWDVANTELVINIFDLGMDVEEAAQMACDSIAEYLNEGGE